MSNIPNDLSGLTPIEFVAGMVMSGTLFTVIKDVVVGIWKARRGISTRDTKRRIDIVQQRDEAIEAQRDAELARDIEAANRRSLQEYAFDLRMQAKKNGYEPLPEPDLDQTQPSKAVRDARRRSESGT